MLIIIYFSVCPNFLYSYFFFLDFHFFFKYKNLHFFFIAILRIRIFNIPGKGSFREHFMRKRGWNLKPLRDDSALRALSSLRGLRGAPEVPPLCRETQSLGQQMLELGMELTMNSQRDMLTYLMFYCIVQFKFNLLIII